METTSKSSEYHRGPVVGVLPALAVAACASLNRKENGAGIAAISASGLLFDFDSDVVRADAVQNLRRLAVSLENHPNTNLPVVWHTAAAGTSGHNQASS